MLNENKKLLYTLYAQLQGSYESFKLSPPTYHISEPTIWNNYHRTIDELVRLTGDNSFNAFKVTITPEEDGNSYVKYAAYRDSLMQVISKVHGDYYSHTANPLIDKGRQVPATVITQTQSQQQSQEVFIQAIVELSGILTKEAENHKEGTPERTFLEQVKSGLSKGKSLLDLLRLILATGASNGLTVAAILKLLGLS